MPEWAERLDRIAGGVSCANALLLGACAGFWVMLVCPMRTPTARILPSVHDHFFSLEKTLSVSAYYLHVLYTLIQAV